MKQSDEDFNIIIAVPKEGLTTKYVADTQAACIQMVKSNDLIGFKEEDRILDGEDEPSDVLKKIRM